MDFSWIDAIMRDEKIKKDKLDRQENKNISKKIRRRNSFKSLGQYRYGHLFKRSR